MTFTELPEFKPNPATRHAWLSGIEQVQNVLTETTVMSEMQWQTFRLPTNYKRADRDIPDLTGFQFCFTTVPLVPFGANVVLQVKQFGEWLTLAEGSIRSNVVADEKEWVDVYFSEPVTINQVWLTQQFRVGVQSDTPIWYSYPFVNANESADVGAGGQLAYKLFAFTADDGEDYLSNHYRSMVRRSAVSNFNTVNTTNVNGFWYSKPNPSKYAVESLYFDVSDANGAATVVDRLLLDPITPGVYFNLYHSSEGEPGTEEREWETKLWTPIYQIFRMERRTEHALPEPVTARYMKIEFSHLQPQHYSPGTFSLPVRYKKHPKWVLDYFLIRLNSEPVTEDPFVSRKVRVIYSALKLGYDYYLDDLRNDPVGPAITEDEAASLNDFLTSRTDVSDLVDDLTMARVSAELQPFTKQPLDRIKGLEYLLAEGALDARNTNYPVENITRAQANTTQVSSLDRERLVVEANYPVMFFYVPSRHTYREIEASLLNDRAYFVGVRELAFTRDHYTVASDQTMYVENLGDSANVSRNDFREEQYLPFNPNPGPGTP